MHKLLKDKEILKKKLYEMYVEKQMSSCMIAKELDVDYKKVYNWLKRCNIPVRNCKEANILSQKMDRNPGMKGKKLSEDTKLKISKKSKGIKRPYNKVKKGTFKKGHIHSEEVIEKIRHATIKQLSEGKMCVCDTSIERLMENQLLFNNILYIKQYPYKLGVADFWLPEYNAIVECDGDYWHSKENMKIRDQKQTKWLSNNEYLVYRFLGSTIRENPEQCIKTILECEYEC